MKPVRIAGCRHDVLGHNLKAMGLLRALATCAETEHRDPEAQGWWDLNSACFLLQSEKYPDEDALAKFFAEHYIPTPVFSAWNTGGGLDEKQELVLKMDYQALTEILHEREDALRAHGYDPGKHAWKDGKLAFELRSGQLTLDLGGEFDVRMESSGRRGTLQKVVIQWKGFSRFLRQFLSQVTDAASIPKSTKEKIEQGKFDKGELCATVKSVDLAISLPLQPGIAKEIRTKTSGEKTVIALIEGRFAHHDDIIKGIRTGRRYFERFQTSESGVDTRELLESFRDELPNASALAMDAVLTPRTTSANDNPIFLRRGEAGNSEIFRAFWSYFLAFEKRPVELAGASLFDRQSGLWDKEKSPGTPFFPDAIKTYNNGLGWIVEIFPFNALDYLLAVEGALALRGAVSRTLAAISRRFAAFPFVFDSGEDLVDDSNAVKGTAHSVWLPLWNRPTTFAELASFICDAQARLPGKEARYTAEFARALRAQGVDAGFSGWQEFRFKMKASRVPWVCTGHYVNATSGHRSMPLNDALAPLDESAFLDQFEARWEGNRVAARSPHPVRTAIGRAIEDTVVQPTPENAIEILIALYAASKNLALSKSFRETLRRPAVFLDLLPKEPWEALLRGLDSPEFRIARALASVTGFSHQADGGFSKVQPLMASLLPLRVEYGRCRLDEKSKQVVWTGADLCHDLARVLSRRYLDSLDDDRPAVQSYRTAPLQDVLEFLRGELDDHRIARWVEALSLIQWRREYENEAPHAAGGNENENAASSAIPIAYAALRALLEIECEWQGPDRSTWRKRRSQRAIALLCQRTPNSLALAVEDALRWAAIWGVPNCWGEEARYAKPRLAGNDIVRAEHRELSFSDAHAHLVSRLAAATLIPLDWRDRSEIYRALTLPQTTR